MLTLRSISGDNCAERTILVSRRTLDRYFSEGNVRNLDSSERAARWLAANVLPAGCWERHFEASDPSREYCSGKLSDNNLYSGQA
jgi:hypothetical protein